MGGDDTVPLSPLLPCRHWLGLLLPELEVGSTMLPPTDELTPGKGLTSTDAIASWDVEGIIPSALPPATRFKPSMSYTLQGSHSN